MPLVEMKDVEKVFETRAGKTWVLRRINISIREGEFVTIMGPSGAGKSTLLSIVGMLDGDWTGQYGFLEHPVHKLSNRQRVELHKQYLGFVFQQFHLLDNLTVAENLDLPLSYRNFKKSERQAMVAEMLDKFQIVGKKDLFPSQLSGGQQQLVAVARALIGNPKVILADEPCGSLHSTQGKMIMDLLKRLNDEGTTVLQVTHNETWAAYAQRIVQLADGWIVSDRALATAG
ncbi:MAG TPA: ABC transporter ATP-binding protein [Candidatus Acidoferrales bacterium]|nr:ABC transporter ATP-binding protein [Candidatus Acidoferrales bacterium]